MTSRTHVEQHFTGSQFVRDIVIGMSDGLTVPFALAAGLSGAVAASRVVVTAGLAEVAAGSIAMGLGGYMAGRSDLEHYRSEQAREEREVRELPEVEEREVGDIFREYGLPDGAIQPILSAFRTNPKAWVEFMMRFELGLEMPDPTQALRSALTIAGAYIAGGLVPLAPYALGLALETALLTTVVLTLVALLVFGAVKARFTGV
ncbi:MAG TPA: VIT1/CCC1 transporter family protein, partial [Gaiellales bacterium]|nr:VIT1/CCC1 transporter family protein [Gaiellales bacterium]